jgi:hypothetical protein
MATTTENMEMLAMKEQMEKMRAEMENVKKENEALKSKVKPITFKVSEKGAMSVYGLNARFPVTLYGQQWVRLLDKKEEMLQFIKDNSELLATK